MKKFNVDKFLEAEDQNEWYRVPGYIVDNLNLNAEELDFVKKLYVGYYVPNTDISISSDRVLDIIRDINLDLLSYSDNYMVVVLPEGYRMFRIAGSLHKIFENWQYSDYME